MGHVWLNENVVLKTCTRCGYTEGSIGGGTLRPTETDVGSSNVSVASTTSTLFDTVTEHHEYTYASGKLLREVITTTATADGETTTTTDTLDFFYDASGTPFAVEHNGTLYYYITNLQGDVMQLVNASGTAVATYEYDPYGNIVSATGDLAETNPLRYRGYVYDTESDLYYCQSRYYDPQVGRFINADALVSTGQSIIGNNMFAYCQNNPIIYSDYSGFCPQRQIDTMPTVVVFLDNCGGSGGGNGGGNGDPSGLLTVACIVGLWKLLDDFFTEEDREKQGAVYYSAYIKNGQWIKDSNSMSFEEAYAWVATKAETYAFSFNASWGLYTEKESDAFEMALALGGFDPVWDKGKSGQYSHYHVYERNLFTKYKHFHIWYGQPNQ